MATYNRKDRRRIEDWSGATTANVIPAGQFRWYDGVTGYNASEVIDMVGDGSTTIASLPKRQPVTNGAQTLYGIKTFDSIPVLPSTAPSSDNQAMSKVHAEALLGLPACYLYGLETEVDTDTDHDIKINIGKCRDYANGVDLELTAAMVKRIDATWAAGTTNGGMFTGAVAVDTDYHYFLIMKDSDSSIDAGWDTDVDCANIPTGYTEYRRIWSHKTDGSSNIKPYNQSGNHCVWDDYSSPDFSSGTVANTRTALTVNVPIDIEPIAKLYGFINGSTTSYVLLYETFVVDMTPSNTFATMSTATGGTRQHVAVDIRCDSSGQISYKRASNTPSVIMTINTLGYIDDRGQHGGK